MLFRSARLLELQVVTPDGLNAREKSRLKSLYAMYLDPTKGPKKLVFADDIEKTYMVKYSGKIDYVMEGTIGEGLEVLELKKENEELKQLLADLTETVLLGGAI